MVFMAALAVLSPGTARAGDPPKALPVTPITVRFYGHGFIYIISSTGVRIAIDPYSEDSPMTYKFPIRLPADVVLVSNEADDSDGSDRLFGSPQVFRSVTAIGINNARGLLFTGVQTYRDKSQGAELGVNATFTFKLDGIRFCHLGSIGHVLDATQRSQIGPVDVLFLPVGNPNLSVPEMNRIAHDLNAKIIVPIKYKTEFTADMNLRPLDDFLAGQANIKKLNASEFSLTPVDIPAAATNPAIYVLSLPQPAPDPSLP